jgi:hypothetical protein
MGSSRTKQINYLMKQKHITFLKSMPSVLFKILRLHYYGEVFHNPTPKHGPLEDVCMEKGMWEEPFPGSVFIEEGSAWKEVCRALFS